MYHGKRGGPEGTVFALFERRAQQIMQRSPPGKHENRDYFSKN